MPKFTVEAVDTKGKKIRASIEASSSDDAIAKLKSRGYKPMKITQAGGGKGSSGGAEAAAPPAAPPKEEKRPAPSSGGSGGPSGPSAPVGVAPPKKKGFSFLGGRVRHKQLTQFTLQLSVLMDAGLPIVRSIKILSNQMKPSALKNITGEVADDLETGSSFSEALAKHPKAFDKLYVNMIKAGEAGGVLDIILARLAAFMERVEALKRKIIGASVYPAVVITIALVVVLVIMKFIVPKFMEVFEKVNVAKPAMTLFLMSVSSAVTDFWFFILLSPVVFFFAIKIWGRTKTGRYSIDRIKLHLPLVGGIIKKSICSRFCRTLGTLLQSGVPILDALSIVKNATGNEVFAKAIEKVHASIREGESIAEPLGASGIFDDIVINMIDVGEETGELDKMLLKVADQYDAEVDAAVSTMMSVLEPILIVGLGGVVGFIVVALFLPLISLLQGIG